MTRSARLPVPERTPEGQSFSTRGHDGDPWEYWIAVTQTAFVAMRATAPAGWSTRPDFEASTIARRTGGLSLSTMSAGPHEAIRTRG
jgi:hypothetical protein